MLLPPRLLKRGADQSTLATLASARIPAELVEGMFRPFLAGVFLEDQLETSGRFFHLVWRSMLRGTLCLPRRGIQAIPEQLAAALPPGTVRLETPVRALTGTGVLLADGRELAADAVVVATGAAAAGALLPGLPVPPTRTVTTVYHAAPASPLAEPTLLVDTEREILNTCVLSDVSPGYSGGRALISSSVLGGAGHVPRARRAGQARRPVRDRHGGLGAPGQLHDRGGAARHACPAAAQPDEPCLRPGERGPGEHGPGERGPGERGPGRAAPVRMRRSPRDRVGPGRARLRRPGRPRSPGRQPRGRAGFPGALLTRGEYPPAARRGGRADHRRR